MPTSLAVARANTSPQAALPRTSRWTAVFKSAAVIVLCVFAAVVSLRPGARVAISESNSPVRGAEGNLTAIGDRTGPVPPAIAFRDESQAAGHDETPPSY